MNAKIRSLVIVLGLATPFSAAGASVVAEYPVPSPASRPSGIGSANGVIWFTEFGANKIARIDAQGVITEIALPTPGSGPEGVMPFGDVYGSVVFTEFNANKIGRVSLGCSRRIPVSIREGEATTCSTYLPSTGLEFAARAFGTSSLMCLGTSFPSGAGRLFGSCARPPNPRLQRTRLRAPLAASRSALR